MKINPAIAILLAGTLIVSLGACDDQDGPSTYSQPVTMSACSTNMTAGLQQNQVYGVSGASYNERTNTYTILVNGAGERQFSSNCLKLAQGASPSLQVTPSGAVLTTNEDFQIQLTGVAQSSPYYGVTHYHPYYVLSPTPTYISPTVVLGSGNSRIFRGNTPTVINRTTTIIRDRQVQQKQNYSVPVTAPAQQPQRTGSSPYRRNLQPVDTTNSNKGTGSGFGSNTRRSTYSAPTRSYSPNRISTPSRSFGGSSRRK